MTAEMLWAVYGIMVVVWIAFQAAVNTLFPKNEFMPKSVSEGRYGEIYLHWGVLTAFLWPATLAYLLFLLLLLPVKGVQLGIKANERRVENKNRLNTIPELPTYPNK